jgi:hypothetical protein
LATQWPHSLNPTTVGIAADRPLPDSVKYTSLALKVLAGIYLVGVMFAVFPGSVPTSLLETVAFNVWAAGLAVILVLFALALDRERPWALATYRALLVLLFVWGTYTFLSLLVGGVFRIPTTTVVTGLVLFLPNDGWTALRLTGRGVVVLALVAALCLLQTATRPIFGWGGYLDVHETDLTAALVVECGSAGPPDGITVSYEWSWAKSAPLPNDEDQIVIGWNGEGTDGRPLYVAIDLPDQSEGFHIGISSGASGPMASQVAATWRGVFLTRLDLHTLEFRPGRYEAQLIRTRAQAAQEQQVTFGATYIHAGVWRKDTPTVTCSW